VDLKGIVEIVRVVDETVSSKRGKASKDDEEQDDDLEDAEDVEEANTPLRCNGVQDNGKGHTSNTDSAATVGILELVAGSIEDITAEREGVAGRKPEQDHLRGQHAGGQVLGVAVDMFEVVLLASGARDRETVLEPDAETAKGQDATYRARVKRFAVSNKM
jgi:hypothetical protein